jgi:hypothetical protein
MAIKGIGTINFLAARIDIVEGKEATKRIYGRLKNQTLLR